MATSTPKPSIGKGVKGPNGGKGKDKARNPPPPPPPPRSQINIQRIENSDDDFIDEENVVGGGKSFYHVEGAYFEHLRGHGISDGMLENET